jgi:hypothetical protein
MTHPSTARKVAWEKRKRQQAVEDRLYVCSDCEHVFQTKFSLKKHEKSRACLALRTIDPCVPVAAAAPEAAASVPAPAVVAPEAAASVPAADSVLRWAICCEGCEGKVKEFLELLPCKKGECVGGEGAEYSQCSSLSERYLWELTM